MSLANIVNTLGEMEALRGDDSTLISSVEICHFVSVMAAISQHAACGCDTIRDFLETVEDMLSEVAG